MSHINKFVFKIGLVLAVVFSTAMYAQEYKVYALYNGEFEAVFPAQPSIVNQPGITAYTSAIKEKQLAFVATKLPSPLGNNVGSYNKKALDEANMDSFKPLGEVISFESTLNKQKGLYIFTVIYSRMNDELGMRAYTFDKRIVTNKSMYRWALISSTMANKSVFEKYKNQSKLRN